MADDTNTLLSITGMIQIVSFQANGHGEEWNT